MRAQVIELVRVGAQFKPQQKIGRRLDFCTRFIIDLARSLDQPVTFAALLDALETQAARREIHGAQAAPIEKIDRVWQVMTFHHPKRGRVQIAFGSLQNKLTLARKKIRADVFTVTPIP